MTSLASLSKVRRFVAFLAGVAAVSILTACTNADYSLTEEDAYGTWRAGSDLPTTLELAEGGTFQATAWPVDVDCDGNPAPPTAKDLRGTKTIDFSGTWEEGEGGSLNEITLRSGSDSLCPDAWIQADFRSEDGVLYACILLGAQVDLATEENWFILYRGEPESTPDSGRCFNYN